MVVKGNCGSALQVQRPDVQRCHEHTPWGNDGRLVLHNHRMLDLETMWLDLGWLPLNGMNTVPILFFSLVWWTNDGMECIDKLTNVRKVWKCRNRMPRLFIGMMDQWWNGMHWKTDDKRQNRLEMPELGSGQWRSQKEKAEGLSPNSLTRERDKTRLFLGCSDGRKWSVCSRLPPCRCTFLSFFQISSFFEFFGVFRFQIFKAETTTAVLLVKFNLCQVAQRKWRVRGGWTSTSGCRHTYGKGSKSWASWHCGASRCRVMRGWIELHEHACYKS